MLFHINLALKINIFLTCKYRVNVSNSSFFKIKIKTKPNNTAMKQLYTSFSKKLFFVITALAMVMTTNTAAQCVQPYKVFESFKAITPALTATATAPGILNGYTLGVSGTDYWRGFGLGISTATSHSGRSSISFTGAAGYLITPKIVSPSSGTMSLGFYYKNLTAGASQLIVEYSSNYAGGGADPATGTWTQLGTTLTTAGTAYAASPLYTFSPGASGFYIRIRRGTGAQVPNIDSLSWYSSDATENLQLVLPVGTVATSCTYSITTGLVYRFFDCGGFDDNSSSTASAINSVTFMPPAGQQINLNFISWQSGLAIGNISLTDTDTALTNYSINALPSPTAYLSSNTLDGSIKADYKTTNNTPPGFEITIEAKAPVSTCSDVSGVTFTTGSETFNSASISWTAPGVLPSGGYDYYVATTATPLPTALTTPSGNVSNSLPSATVTGLLSDTTYYVWVRSNCGGNLGSWKQGATTFRTLCSPFPIPYTENFNGLNGPIPTCTTKVRAWATNISDGSLFTNDASTAPYPMFFSKPVSLVAGTTYRLSYDYSTTVGSGTANFNVYYGTTNTPPTQANINTLLASYVGISSLTGNVVNFIAPSTGTFYIGFLLQGFSIPSTTFFKLDNIVLDVEQCLPPTAVTNSGINYTAATVSWTASASAPANGYQYLVTTSSAAPTYTDPPTGTTAAGVTTVNLALTPGTSYYVWVRSNCGGTYSIWSSTNFTTPTLPLSTGVNMSNGSLTICGASAFGSAVFFDSGGSTGAYTDNQTFTYTFIPAVAGSKLKVVFSSFNTENRYDGLSIYNGPNTTFPLISSGLPAGILPATCPAGSFYGTNSPGTIYSSSPNGEITFKFTSDTSVTAPGWAATVTCVTVPVIDGFLPSDNSCNPISTPTLVTITGSNFTGVTSVKFNGVSASYTLVNATTITATLPAGASTGIISVSNLDATGFSTTSFTVYAPAPNATGSTICAATEPGVLSSTTDCAGYVLPVSTISGAWAATDAIANRPTGSANSTACAFAAATPRGYTSIQFQVSQTGTYTFQMANDTNFDGMGYITSGAFVPGSCASGSFVIGDDDSGVNEPRMSAVLTAGVTYTLYSTYWADIAPTYYSYTWNISTTSSGQVLLYDTAPVAWFTSASGGTAIGTGSPFNPVGVPGSGLTTSSVAGNYTFYAACPSNPTCRKAVVVVVKPSPTVTPPANASVCANTIKALTVSGTANTYTWTSSVANTLYSDANATILYVPGTSANTVYLKTGSTATITITGAQPASCSTIVTTTQTVQSKIWNGTSWVGGAPTATDGIIINGSGSAFGSLQGCSCTVTNGTVVFNNGETLTILNDLSVIGGTLTFENGASLVQLNTPASNTNTGNITYKRNTSMRKFDYTYWSSPVGSQSLFNLSPTTLPDKYFSWNAIGYSWTPLSSATFMDAAKGYIIRGPQAYPDAVLTAFTGTFQGIPNNGNYSVSITKSALGDLNLIGNPYPSAVDASLFILGNAPVFGGGTTLYFWTHNTPITNNSYVGSDYAVYNFSGSTGTGTGVPGANSTPPSGKIAAGQGFMAKGINLGTQTATFRNTMRIAGNNTNFYRMQYGNDGERDDELVSQKATIEGLERHRIWLDLSNDQGVFKQLLLAYVEDATNSYDDAFDGEAIDVGASTGFYSLLSTNKLAIQGRALPFDENDIIPLGLQLPAAGSYELQLSNFDGLFADASTPVYLEDQLMHVVHNLRQGPYTFVSQSGTYDQRFVIRFTDNLLQVPVSDFDENSVVVFKNNNSITVQSSNLLMKEVNLYDVRGRLILAKNNLETDKVIFENLAMSQQVLLVHITTENGTVVVKKIIF